MALEEFGLVSFPRLVQQIAQPLRPRHGRRSGRRDQSLGIDPFGQFSDDRRGMFEPARMMRIADEIDRRGLDGRDPDCAAGRVEELCRYIGKAFADDKNDPDRAACDSAPLLPRHNLKFLRPVMSGAVILSGGKQPDVIAEAKLFHQRRDELIGGQASEPPVLGRDNDVESMRRMRNQPLPGKPVQCEHDGVLGAAERFPRFLRREMIPAARDKSVNVAPGVRHSAPEIERKTYHILKSFANDFGFKQIGAVHPSRCLFQTSCAQSPSSDGNNVGASVKARLTRRASERKENVQLALTHYAMERLLYRLGISAYSGRFVLKGAMLFSLWAPTPYRATGDLDLLGYGDAAPKRIAAVFREICGIDVEDDGVVFKPDTLRAESLGLKTSIAASGSP